jgi:hypothetical protein
MDFAAFQAMFPDLIVVYQQCEWEGSQLQTYNFINSNWDELQPGSAAEMFSDVDIDIIEGAIKSAAIADNFEVALVVDRSGQKMLTGIVRGKGIRIAGEDSFSLDDFAIDLDGNYEGSNFEAPDFFSSENDLKRELQ